MLKRKIIKKLEDWKESTTNKAFLIKGARQVGKTTIVRLQGDKFLRMKSHYMRGNNQRDN